ncbi:hypothetical protein B0T09DRAFT_344263 [Sordaria sp. MPI-SDFR-AT-0083]|nr:hypothetical protein B0T09DRAFT_344263 [Sordaria sp. MPI-SDFR-AT-0083]
MASPTNFFWGGQVLLFTLAKSSPCTFTHKVNSSQQPEWRPGCGRYLVPDERRTVLLYRFEQEPSGFHHRLADCHSQLHLI